MSAFSSQFKRDCGRQCLPYITVADKTAADKAAEATAALTKATEAKKAADKAAGIE